MSLSKLSIVTAVVVAAVTVLVLVLAGFTPLEILVIAICVACLVGGGRRG
ncbi:hypothetical protein [Nocardioides sp. LHG3406-4]